MEGQIEQIFHALKLAVDELGSQVAFAERAHIQQSYIHKYLAGKTKTMEIDIFLRIYPHIKKHLPEGFLADTECEKLCAGMDNSEKGLMKDIRQYSKQEKERLWKLHEDIKEERLKNKTASVLAKSG